MSGSAALSFSVPGGSVRLTVGPPALDPVMRGLLEVRWRALWLEARWIAGQLGWEDRLPQKQS